MPHVKVYILISTVITLEFHDELEYIESGLE